MSKQASFESNLPPYVHFPYKAISVLVYQNILRHSSLDPRSIRAPHRGLNQSFSASNRLHFRYTVAILKGAPTKRKRFNSRHWLVYHVPAGRLFLLHHPRTIHGLLCVRMPHVVMCFLCPLINTRTHGMPLLCCKRELSPSLVDWRCLQ